MNVMLFMTFTINSSSCCRPQNLQYCPTARHKHTWLRCTLVHKVAYNKHRSAPCALKLRIPALLPHSGFHGVPSPFHPSCGALAKVCLTDAYALGMASVRQTLAHCLLHTMLSDTSSEPENDKNSERLNRE